MNTSKKPRRKARSPYVDGTDVANAGDHSATKPGGAAPAEKRPTKQSLVLDLLQRDGGAALTDIAEATGWLPHTARAVLTGLRKKGHAIERATVDGKSRYTIAAVVAE